MLAPLPPSDPLSEPFLTELTSALIRRPSVTPADAGCQEQLAAWLEPFGYRVRWMPFEDVTNVWIERGTTGPLCCLLGHTDVVPTGPEEQWRSPPFEPTLRDGDLYGRGACDMKSGVAAMVAAMIQIARQHGDRPGRIAMLMTSDEEGLARHGTREVMETLAAEGTAIDWCIVGEPSSKEHVGDRIRVGRRGSLRGNLTVKGVQGHVAYPQLALNPVHTLAPALDALVKEVWDEGNAHFPATTFQVSNIHAGTGAPNVIPGHLELVFNLRFGTAIDQPEIERRVTALLDAHGVDYDLTWHLSGNPFLTEKGPLVAAVDAAARELVGSAPEHDTGGGTSDGRFVAPTGAQVVELGPVGKTLHKINEHVAVADLPVLARLYTRVLEQFLDFAERGEATGGGTAEN